MVVLFHRNVRCLQRVLLGRFLASHASLQRAVLHTIFEAAAGCGGTDDGNYCYLPAVCQRGRCGRVAQLSMPPGSCLRV